MGVVAGRDDKGGGAPAFDNMGGAAKKKKMLERERETQTLTS
jgi:hypothetical protein